MNTAEQASLRAQDVTVTIDSKTLLDKVSLEVQGGQMLGVIGPNGAGKSTLLKALAGLQKTDSGNIELNGRDISRLSAGERALGLSWLEQRPQLHWPLTVRQVVALGRLPHRHLGGGRHDRQAIGRAMEFTDVAGLADRQFPTLSEGEKLLVNLARVLASESRILLADEPNSALDPEHQLLVMELLQRLASEGCAIITVLHDLTLAARYCERLLLLQQGRVVGDGAPETVLGQQQLADVYRIRGNWDPVSRSVLVQGRLQETGN